MKRLSKKLLSLLLSLLMLVSVMPLDIINAYAATYYYPVLGNCSISSGYGPRWGKYHYGIDIVTNGNNNKVVSTRDGIVKEVYDECDHHSCGYKCKHWEKYGNLVVVQHSDGSCAYYGHLEQHSIRVSVGQRVVGGQWIANVGDAGYVISSTGKGHHLHFEIRTSYRATRSTNTCKNVNPSAIGYTYLSAPKDGTDGPHPPGPEDNYQYDANARYDIGIYRCDYKQGVKIRTGPGTQHTRIGLVSYQGDIYIGQTSGNWGYGRFAGKEGWVCLNYLTKVSIPVPSTPTISGISAENIAKGKTATIYWNGVSGASGYRIAVRGAETKDVDVGNVTSYTFRLDKSASYNFHVQAYNVSGSSSWSGYRTCTAHDPVKVRFVDWDGTELTNVQTIDWGTSAQAPDSPSRKGYTFQGWNDSYYNVTTDKTIKATYKIITYTVNFFDREGTLIESQKVDYGHDATPPTDTHESSKYKFQGWNSTDYIDVYTERTDKNINIDGVYSWYNYELPAVCEITSATRQFAGYNAVFNIENNDIYPTTGRAVVALKTSEGKLVEMTESTAFSIPAGKTKSGIEVFVPCTKPAAIMEVFMVSDYSSGVPISPSVTASITEGLMYEESAVKPSNDDGALDIQEVTQYSYRDKEFSTGNTKTKSGWEYTGNRTEQAGGWSGWGWNYIAGYDNESQRREVQTQTAFTGNYNQKLVYHFYHCHLSNGNVTPTWNDSTVHYLNLDYDLGWVGTSSVGSTPMYGYYSAGSCKNVWYRRGDYQWYEPNYDSPIYGTQYRYRDINYIYNFYRWKNWTDWSDTAVSASENRDVRTRTIYRYKSNVVLPEDNSGTERTISGTVDTAFAGKQITLYVYGYTGASDYTNEYIGQSTVGNDGSYSFTFKLREEPTEKTGNFTVAIGIEGTSNTTVIDTIEAPKPTYTVNFYDWYGNIINTQSVTEGENAELPEAPELEGYDFLGWDKSVTNIKEDTDIYADYAKQKFTVVFVDWENQQIEVRNFNYGEELQTPEFANIEGYTFKGWDTILEGTTVVTQNMIVAAVYEANEYKVDFLDWDGNVVETQTVKYGESAIAADDLEAEGMNFTGWFNPEDYQNVTQNATIFPSYYFDETTETPVANYETGEYEENLRLSLSTSDENAVIYYYLNDDETTEAIYTKPITIDKTCSVTYYATSFGKNDSDKETKYYCINKSGEPSDWMPYNDLPQEVKDNPSEYALEQEDGYRYKDTTETSSASEAAALEYEDWQQESAAYTDYTEWQDEEIAVDDSLIGFEVDTQEVPDTTKTRYQYSHYKYVDNGETKFAKNAVEGFDCEYEEIIVDSRLSIAGFTDDNVSYYSYNDEQWFTQTKVSGVKTQYRSRHQVATYYRWTDWDIDTPSSEEQREYEEEEVYRYANKNYHIVTVLIPGTDSTNILLIEDGDIIPLTIFEEYGYSINGLYLSDDFSGEFDIETPIEDSLQLYINYVPKSFTVTFQMQDGSEIDTQSVSYLDAAVEPETDAVPGWVFNGWDKEFDCITEDTVVTGSYVKESEYAYVSLDRNTANMYQGNTLKLNATITPNNLVDEQLEWSSSNTGVATVDDNGNVTAVNEGTATITVRVVKTKESAECKLVIKADADHYLVLANNSTLNYDSLGYLRRVKLGATAEDVAKEFTNPLSDIKLFGFNGAELSPSKLVGTGTQIKLYNGDEATDTRTMIITGDMTGDGIINNRDVAMFNRYLVNKVTVEDFQALAVDVNGDGYVNNRDAAMIARYLVGKDRF